MDGWKRGGAGVTPFILVTEAFATPGDFVFIRAPLLAGLFKRSPAEQSQAAVLAAYATYGAVPKERANTALSLNGELVVTLWEADAEEYDGQQLTFNGTLEGQSGPGVADFRECLQEAFLSDRAIRLVIARTENTAARESPASAICRDTTFHAQPDWRGRVMCFDGDRYVICFRGVHADGRARRRADQWQRPTTARQAEETLALPRNSSSNV